MSETETKISAMIAPYWGKPDAPLFEGGLEISSIKLTELILEIEETFDVDLDVDEFYACESVAAVAAYVDGLRT